jgi:F0F1-type ATP synthase membrane subunit b/b'
MESLIAPIFNLLLLIALLSYKLRRPLSDFLLQRPHTLRTELYTVREQLKEAQQKYDEFSAKLKAIDAEIATLREQSIHDAGAMKQRLITEARRIATHIVLDAKSSAENLFLDLKNQLYIELSTRVLDRAEHLLKERLTGDDRARIRQEFSRQVESIQ